MKPPQIRALQVAMLTFGTGGAYLGATAVRFGADVQAVLWVSFASTWVLFGAFKWLTR